MKGKKNRTKVMEIQRMIDKELLKCRTSGGERRGYELKNSLKMD